MNRRHFLQSAGLTSAIGVAPFFSQTNGVAWSQVIPSKVAAVNTPYNNLLILIELKGANDGLNTVVPISDPTYQKLRRTIALERNDLITLTEREAMHASLKPLLPLWENKELAVVQGLGYPNANLSHFRSIEIWETASKSEEYLDSGWLARTFANVPTPKSFAADGVVVGSYDMGHCQAKAHALLRWLIRHNFYVLPNSRKPVRMSAIKRSNIFKPLRPRSFTRRVSSIPSMCLRRNFLKTHSQAKYAPPRN